MEASETSSAPYGECKLYGATIRHFGSLMYLGGRLHVSGGIVDQEGQVLIHPSEVIVMHMLFDVHDNGLNISLLSTAMQHGFTSLPDAYVISVGVTDLGKDVVLQRYLIELRGKGEVLVDALESATHLMQDWLVRIHSAYAAPSAA